MSRCYSETSCQDAEPIREKQKAWLEKNLDAAKIGEAAKSALAEHACRLENLILSQPHKGPKMSEELCGNAVRICQSFLRSKPSKLQ